MYEVRHVVSGFSRTGEETYENVHRIRRRHPRRWSCFGVASLGVAPARAATWPTRRSIWRRLQYDAAEDSLDEAGAVRRTTRAGCPWLGCDERQEIRARDGGAAVLAAAVRRAAAGEADPVAAVEDDNVELQLVVANAAYRAGQGRYEATRPRRCRRSRRPRRGYLTVLKNGAWHERRRLQLRVPRPAARRARQGQAAAAAAEGRARRRDNGEAGAPSAATNRRGSRSTFRSKSGEKNPAGGEAGKAAPKERKG